MRRPVITSKRLNDLLEIASASRVLVIGDVMLDQFVYGKVGRISPEAPVPVVEFERETLMPGGAANVARNLRALGAHAELLSVVGSDDSAATLRRLLDEQEIVCDGLVVEPDRLTSIKTRIIAHHQQVVRLDRETRHELTPQITKKLLQTFEQKLGAADAVIACDYGKGVLSQGLLDAMKRLCRERGIWLSLDPKPVHHLDLTGLSLITPNRKEAFELAGQHDNRCGANPLEDAGLMRVADQLLNQLRPALLLITLGEQGMLLCKRGQKPFHVPTVAQEVFDVSGAGDTVIASFTLTVTAGASPIEAALFSNHAAGVVVGKMGTAVVTPADIVASFRRKS